MLILTIQPNYVKLISDDFTHQNIQFFLAVLCISYNRSYMRISITKGYIIS